MNWQAGKEVDATTQPEVCLLQNGLFLEGGQSSLCEPSSAAEPTSTAEVSSLYLRYTEFHGKLTYNLRNLQCTAAPLCVVYFLCLRSFINCGLKIVSGKFLEQPQVLNYILFRDTC